MEVAPERDVEHLVPTALVVVRFEGTVRRNGHRATHDRSADIPPSGVATQLNITDVEVLNLVSASRHRERIWVAVLGLAETVCAGRADPRGLLRLSGPRSRPGLRFDRAGHGGSIELECGRLG